MYLYVCKQQSTTAIVLFLCRNANVTRCLWEKSPISAWLEKLILMARTLSLYASIRLAYNEIPQ
jgi:hypothetical protein